MGTLDFEYTFIFDEENQETFTVQLDEETLEPVDDSPADLPDWTRLDVHQCSHCPLAVETHPHCPLAARLVNLVGRFESVMSYQNLRVVAAKAERTVMKDTTAQEGISSLMGLIMATSGCPHTALFRPMARFHLPMATGEETVYRAASMYLFAQYFVNESGGEPDLELKGLREVYENLQTLNSAMADRIREAISRDAAVNAIVILDFFALRFSFEVESHLNAMRPLFRPYLEQQEQNGEAS